MSNIFVALVGLLQERCGGCNAQTCFSTGHLCFSFSGCNCAPKLLPTPGSKWYQNIKMSELEISLYVFITRYVFFFFFNHVNCRNQDNLNKNVIKSKNDKNP